MLICEAVEPDGKTCRLCKQYKSLDDYSKGSMKYGKQNACKSCTVLVVKDHVKANPKNRAVTSRKTYLKRYRLASGEMMTPAIFEDMWTAQGGCCKSCSDPLRRGPGGAAVDHDHTTDVVRALLCQGCNMSLGAQKDDPVRLRKLADYVEAHNATQR